MATKKLHFETLQVHVGQEQADPATDARAVPIYQTTSYVFHDSQHAADRFGLRDAGNIYGRLTNSTQRVFEARVAALEGGVAGLAVASGAAAVTYALQNILGVSDHIVAADNLYGGSFNLITHTLATQGITHTIVNVNDLQALEAAIRENTKAVYVETFGNPNSDVTNIDAVAEVAHRHNIPLIVDNTFGTPYLIRPIEHGADIVVHSATKFIGGHGSSLGGVIVDSGNFDWKANADKFPTLGKPDPSYHGAVFADVAGPTAFVTRIRAVILRDTGATISPFNAFILLQGLETLSLRVERHVANALKVVEYLSKHPKVTKVNHPALPDHPDHELYKKYFPKGAGSIFTFEIEGGQEAAWKFIDSLEIFSLLANVADVKSLVIHPYTTTHSQMTPEAVLQIIEMVKSKSGADIKNLLGQLLAGLEDDNMLKKLDISKISDSDIEKLISYVIDGFPLNYRTTQLEIKNEEELVRTVNDLSIYLDKDLFDIFMPALYPMLPDVDALLKNTNIEFWGQSIPLWNMIQMLTALNSMTEIEGIWNVTTRFNLGISLGDNSYKK